MKDLLAKLWDIFDGKEKIGIFCLLAMILAGACFEVIGIGALLPFIALLNRPELVNSNPFLNGIFVRFSGGSFNGFMICAGAGLIAVFVVKNLYLCLAVHFQSLFMNRKCLRLSSRLYRSYLLSPYTFHLQRNSAELLRNIQNVFVLSQGLLWPILLIFTEGAVVIIICAALLWTSFVISGSVIAVLALSMLLFYVLVRKKLRAHGEMQQYHIGKTIQNVNQGLGSIKETKILGCEDFFSDAYSHHFKEVIRAAHFKQVITQAPRFYIETVAVALVLLVMIGLLMSGSDSRGVLFRLSMLAVAAARLMPSLTRISTSVNTIRFYIPSFNRIYRDLVDCERSADMVPGSGTFVKTAFEKNIEFRNVSFRYEGSAGLALKTVSINIPVRKVVGFVGPSGAGKTTAVDILLGLLKPTAGSVCVDGADVAGNIAGWQRQIGYIPQDIYLSDDTIKANVAFGVPEGEIDEGRVWDVLKMAQLEALVRSLPEKIGTVIGEKGTRISGGERQRVGIARALYHDPDVLVMDEATAALDNETERMFMKVLLEITARKTVVMIAHRLTTIRNCDTIFFLEKGGLAGSGSYAELLEKCPGFRHMTEIAKIL
ncbi:MAG: ABC transporter ATP-binding protein [Candidatus Omnitrophica bacterium]|nr:ABC transporter ATP-binding protein [Candidatus Omnitrophota bacterium]